MACVTDILLATFNSERHLAAQLDSLLAQTDRDWRLLVRDAGSTDGTAAILDSYCKRDKRIQIVSGGPASACENFAALLATSTAPYAAFCDHDDVWFPDKLERTLARLRAIEAESASGTPVLVFTDAIVADDDLHEISHSFFECAKLDPTRLAPQQLAFQNVAPGCSMAFNAALREKALPIPPEAVMHDHWLMLVAASFGRVECLREPTFQYRQHGDNVLGAPKVGAGYFFRRMRQGVATLRGRLYANVRQAEAFVARFGDSAPPCLRALVGFEALPPLARRRVILRHRLFKSGLLRNLGTLAIA